MFTKISSTATLPVVTVFVGAINATREVVIPILNESVNPWIDLFKPETKILSPSFNSTNGKYFALTWVLSQVNTKFSNNERFVSIVEIPRPTISLTSAFKPVPFESVLSKDARSPTLYPVPGLSMLILSTSPFDTDVTSAAEFIDSLDSMRKS